MSIQALADLLEEEMNARRWTARDVAIRLVMEQFQIEQLALEMLLACRSDPNIIMAPETLDQYAKAFGVSSEFFHNLYAADSPVALPAQRTSEPTPAESESEPHVEGLIDRASVWQAAMFDKQVLGATLTTKEAEAIDIIKDLMVCVASSVTPPAGKK